MPRASATTAERWSIEPRGEGVVYRVRELWHYRYLVWYFASRTLGQMFRGTALRPLWLIMRVTAPIGLSSIIFGGVLDVPSGNLPYFLFFVTGMAPWTLLETGAMFVTRSLERNRRLITKVYFPRLILPTAALTPALIELGIVVAVLLGTLVYHAWVDGHWYARRDEGLVAASLAILGALLLAFGFGLWTSVLQTRYRDVRYTLRYGMRFWFYFTPVIYPLSHIPEKWRWISYLNPMTPVVESFKWGLLGVGEPSISGVVAGTFSIVSLLAGGLWFFLSNEAQAVDRL